MNEQRTRFRASRAASPRRALAPRRGVATRLVGRLGGSVVQVVLVVLALFWLMPTIGLLISSFRDNADIQSSGWWRVFSNNIDVLAPGAFLSMIIPLAVFFGFQRWFTQGIMASAVK